MNRAKFFAAAKMPVFGKSYTAAQVAGIDAVLDACAAHAVVDGRHIAYILATPMIETGGSFVPIVESLNYSTTALLSKFPKRITKAQAEAYGRNTKHAANQVAIGNIIYGGSWGAKNLGNTQEGDGFKYRGRGLVQITGRRLYEIFGHEDEPDGACEIKVAADIMVRGMRDGTFTTKKLSDYLGIGTDWVGARRIVNGSDRAADIANYAKKFYAAYKASV